ncbi:unannotated protein [freshwater metagenome]|uniref:Unannotated protein n=1 Tax=freshwater metagenome TaxID=449393 RepID=A0A6J7UKV9_9ZZZZ|nr:hypothetical protein [Actinomycetota bacterium]
MFATVGIVTVISAVLILGGIGLFGLTIWFWRTSRPEPEALAPLEIMSERAYLKSKGVDRAFLLNMVRPTSTSEDLPVALQHEPVDVAPDIRVKKEKKPRLIEREDDSSVETPSPMTTVDPLL